MAGKYAALFISPRMVTCQKKGGKLPAPILPDNLFILFNYTYIFPPPNVSCFSHNHTLPFFFQFSSHVSHQTTHSHTLSHTHIPTIFQPQTSHHSPHLSTLPCFSLHTLHTLHPIFPSPFSTTHLSHSSSIHILSKSFSLYTVLLFTLSMHFNFFFK